MPLEPGSRIGPYEVSSLIGAGGMGEVYRATDTTLKRQVAIKVLPAAVAEDVERLARFQREAEVLAQLNHPNIAAIYGLDRTDSQTALVMELVEGPTLADRIAQGPIPLQDVLPIAKQMAEALEAAHEQGIIHRDLKPANIKVRPDGTVKVLDFGLAKAVERSPGTSSSASMSPTITTPAMTQAGMILGTAAYMSPEQAKGRPADRRSDVWAFGCVLYEMLTGTRAFGAEDVSETLAAVLRAEVDWSALPAGLSPAVRLFLQRCLQKDPKRRLGDIQDMRLALDGAFDPPAERRAATTLRVWQRPAPAAAIALALVVTTIAVSRLVVGPGPEASLDIVRTTITPSADEPLRVVGSDPSVAITPDGRHVVYNTGRDNPTGGISVRALDQLSGARLADLPTNVDSPFLSPDGEWVGFDDRGMALARVPLLGGLPQIVTPIDGALRGASWGEDDTIVFATEPAGTGLFRVRASGGEPEVLTTPAAGELDHLWPEVLPGGRAVLFTIVTGSIAEASIAVLDLDTRQYRVLIRGGSSPKYVRTGHIVYAEPGGLRAVAFDLERLVTVGNSRLVVEGVRTAENGAAQYGVGRNGSLVYLTAPRAANQRGRLVWLSRDGRERGAPLASDLEEPRSVRLSPDGQQVAAEVGWGRGDLWVYDVMGRPPIRITSGGAYAPLWTPDGTKLLYTDDGMQSVFALPSDGSGGTPVPASPRGRFSALGLLDGGQTVVGLHEVGPQRDIVRWRLDDPERFEPVVQTPAYEGAFGVDVSPDGRWLAYASDRDGAQEIFVQPYPGPGPTRRVSPAGGHQPVWRPDGGELYYLEGSRLMAVAVDSGADFGFKAPVDLFDIGTDASRDESSRLYDVSADGRFLVVRYDQRNPADSRVELVLVQNWVEEVRRLVPTP